MINELMPQWIQRTVQKWVEAGNRESVLLRSNTVARTKPGKSSVRNSMRLAARAFRGARASSRSLGNEALRRRRSRSARGKARSIKRNTARDYKSSSYSYMKLAYRNVVSLLQTVTFRKPRFSSNTTLHIIKIFVVFFFMMVLGSICSIHPIPISYNAVRVYNITCSTGNINVFPQYGNNIDSLIFFSLLAH